MLGVILQELKEINCSNQVGHSSRGSRSRVRVPGWVTILEQAAVTQQEVAERFETAMGVLAGNEAGSSKVAVALFIHARPRETEQVLAAIKSYQPRILYVIADGPRPRVLGETEKCAEARAVIDREGGGWDVRWIRRSDNVGAGKSVKEGLDWVFSQEERAIVLEDDTVPDNSFFSFCEELLFRYEHDPRIGMISGNNLIQFPSPGNFSYFFTQTPTTWGWATWRRAWECNDFEMTWLERSDAGAIREISVNRRHFHYWRWAIGLIKKGRVDAWDWQWNASLALHGQLAIVPGSNLVKNIGFGEGATHTRKPPKGMRASTSSLPLPLKHPLRIETCGRYDRQLITRYLPDRRPESNAMRKLVSWIINDIPTLIYRRFVVSGRSMWAKKSVGRR